MHIPIARRAVLAVVLSAGTVAAAGAGTFHRTLATQTTGSNGATNFLQSTESASALQGNVGTSDTGYPTPFGVLGVYNPTGSTFGIGVLGLSATGYGIAGESLGSQPSILAYPGGTGVGLEATTPSSSPADAIYAETKGTGTALDGKADGSGYGVFGYSMNGAAVAGVTPGTGGVGVVGAQGGEGVQAFGYSGSSAHPALTVLQRATGTDLVGMYNNSGTKTVIVQANTANRSFATLPGSNDVQIAGDVYLYGRIYQDCAAFPAISSTNCYNTPLGTLGTSSVSRTIDNRNVRTYASQQTLPTMEDFGQAHLAGGRTYVRIDPAFAATMARKPYLVFVTPAGDCRGLYVTNRSIAGFEVRELGNGRATVDFDYRIVATPLGERAERLAAIVPKTIASAAPDPAALAARRAIDEIKSGTHRAPAIVDLAPPSFGHRFR